MHNIFIEKQIKFLSKRIAEDQNLDQKSAKEILLTSSAKTKDDLAIDNEHFFKLRFGFLKPKEQRKHFIYLKRQLDLTDREVTTLYSSKMVKFNSGSESIIESDAILFSLGVFAFFSKILLFIVFTLLAITAMPDDFYDASYLLIIIIILFFGLFHIYKYTFTPVDILMSRGISLGKKLVFNGNSFSIF